MRNAIFLLALALAIAGCASQGGPGAASSGSANFQRCISQCAPGNAGNGSFCKDGCRVQEASDTNSTYWCDQLDNQANKPSCYGTVAKSSGDRSICDRLQNQTDRSYCVSVFGSPGTG